MKGLVKRYCKECQKETEHEVVIETPFTYLKICLECGSKTPDIIRF